MLTIGSYLIERQTDRLNKSGVVLTYELRSEDDPMFNLLTEPLIRIDTSRRGRIDASLPEVYAALMADEVEAFLALRPHQHHAWHAFLVQLGAMAMHCDGWTPPQPTRKSGAASSAP